MPSDELPRNVIELPGWGWPLTITQDLRDPRAVQVGQALLPETFHTTIQNESTEGPTWSVTLMYAVVDDGVFLLLVLTDGEDVPVALERLRRMRPLEWWKRRAVRDAARDMAEHSAAMIFHNEDEGLLQLVDDPKAVAILENLAQQRSQWVSTRMQAVETVPTTRRRDRITPEHLAQVADVYRQAIKDERKPTKAVAEHFSRPHSTAADWVLRARKAGVLGAADGTRGGER